MEVFDTPPIHKSTPRQSFDMISTPFDLNKNQPHPTTPSELAEPPRLIQDLQREVQTFAGSDWSKTTEKVSVIKALE